MIAKNISRWITPVIFTVFIAFGCNQKSVPVTKDSIPGQWNVTRASFSGGGVPSDMIYALEEAALNIQYVFNTDGTFEIRDKANPTLASIKGQYQVDESAQIINLAYDPGLPIETEVMLIQSSSKKKMKIKIDDPVKGVVKYTLKKVK